MTPAELKRLNIERFKAMLDKEPDDARREALAAALERERERPLDDYPTATTGA